MEKKKKKQSWFVWLSMGFSFLMGAGLGIWLVTLMGSNENPNAPLWQTMFEIAILLLGFCLAMYIQVIVHEAGHLVFGLLTGYRFVSFRIGGLMWLKQNGKIVCKKMRLAGTGGQCLMAPPDLVDGKMPVVWYNLGGSILNLVVSGILFGVYLWIGSGTVVSTCLILLVITGLIGALSNGIPMRTGGVDNDGYNAIAVCKNREAMWAFWLSLRMNELLTQGVRVHDMPEEWFEMPSDEAMKNSMVATIGAFTCGRLMEERRWEEADQRMAHIQQTDTGLVGLNLSLLVCDRMYIELIRENRWTVIQEMYTKEQKKFMLAMKEYPSVIRTEYAYALLAEKNMEMAAQKLALFEKVAKTYPYPSDIESEREYIEIAQKAAKKEYTAS